MTSVNQLDPFFTSLISDLMILERQPLTRLQTQKDTLNVRSTAYGDVKTRLSELQSSVKSLISNSTTYKVTTGRTAAITNVSSGLTVLTASAGNSAVPGTYNLHVERLAAEHRIRTRRFSYADQALNLTAGTLLLGGATERDAALALSVPGTVEDFLEGTSIAVGQSELGSGEYFVEVREDPNSAGSYQFRLVNGEGKAASIKQGTTSTYTAGWQAISAGDYDTGRGLKIQFGAGPAYTEGTWAAGTAASAQYTAKAAQIAIGDQSSLSSIVDSINSASYAEGMGVSATIVDNMLILSARSSGRNIVASNLAGGSDLLAQLELTGGAADPEDQDGSDAFTHTLQKAASALFTVNGVSVTRSQNSSLSDVIAGVTLNLAADAAGKDATLTIGSSWSDTRAAIDNFISKFNGIQTYLAQKTGVESTTINGVTNYARGILADDNIFSDLRSDLFFTFMADNGSGALKNLREIGLVINDNLQATVSDSDRLEAALNANLGNVKALLDSVMGAIDAKLGRFTGIPGQTGYLEGALTNFTSEITGIDQEIADMNVRLQDRESSLIDQYAAMQAQLLTLQYSQSMWSGIYSSMNRYV